MRITDKGGDFEAPPTGTHIARCVRLIDIGTQESEYQGVKNIRRQIIVGWELPTEFMKTGNFAGQPFLVSQFYTASLSEKANLRKDLKSWRGRDFTKEELEGFEIDQILGKPCMLGLAENDKQKVKVVTVSALPRGMTCPGQINPMLHLSLESEEFDADVFNGLSDKMKAIIQRSPEYAELFATAPSEAPASTASGFDDMDDDIPF